MLRNFLKGYFGFNKQQRNGLIVLLALSFVLLIIRISLPYFIHPDKEIIIKNLPLLPKEKKETGIDSAVNKSKPNNQTYSNLFLFDPNLISMEQLLQLGLKQNTANEYIKCRNKGFVFRKKEDFKKIRGITEEIYASLQAYILIDESKRKDKALLEIQNHESEIKPEHEITKNKFPIVKIELNLADTQQFITLQQIDLSAARRIIKYRERIGGFVALHQLKEVYGFDEAYCKKIESYFTVNLNLIKKINPNKEAFYRLSRHPYIGSDIAKRIMDRRKKSTLNSGNFAELINDKALFEKLSPYLTFD